MSDPNPASPPTAHRRRFRIRIRIRTLVLLVAVAAAALGIWRSLSRDSDPQRAWTGHQIRALNHPDPQHRRAAAEVLATAGVREDRRVAPALTATLADDPDAQVRRNAAFALGRVLPGGWEPRDATIAAQARAAMGVLLAALDDRDAGVRRAAIATLGHLHMGAGTPRWATIDPGLMPVFRALNRMARDPDPNVRAEALSQIGWLAPNGGDVPTVLLDALDDPVESVRFADLDILRSRAPYTAWRGIDAIAARIVPRLEPASDNERSWLVSILDLLGVTPPEEALPLLLRMLDGDELPGWQPANLAHLLGRYGDRARPALPGLARLAGREINAEGYPLPAVEAIFRIDPDSPEAREMAATLARLHRDTLLISTARDVAAMLAGLGAAARPALPILRETAQTGRTPDQREQAARAIEAIEAADE